MVTEISGGQQDMKQVPPMVDFTEDLEGPPGLNKLVADEVDLRTALGPFSAWFEGRPSAFR